MQQRAFGGREVGRVYVSQCDGASGYAGRIQEALTSRFGQGYVLVAAGPPGIRKCDAMAILIDRRWLGGLERASGIARAGNSVRLEISTAFQAGLRVIPVLLPGTLMPRAADLPADIGALARLQALRVDDEDWDHDIERLAEVLAAAPPVSPPILATTASSVCCLRTIGGEVRYVGAVTFSDDGVVVSAGADGGVRVHRASDGKLLRAVDAHRERATAVAVAGGHLATGSTDGTVRVWRVTDLEFETQFRTASRTVFWLHRHFAGEVLDAVLAAALAPSGSTVAFGDGGGGVRLGRLADSHTQRVGAHTDRVTTLAFSPDGLVIASGGWDGTIRLWRTEDGRPVATMTTPERDTYPSVMRYEVASYLKQAWWVNGLCFSTDGELLTCAGGSGKVQLWRVSDRVHLVSWQAHEHDAVSGGSFERGVGLGLQAPLLGGINCVAYGPGDETIASGGDDTHVRIWRTSDGVCLADLGGHAASVTSVAFSPSGRLLASAGWDGAIKIWAVCPA